MNTKRLYFIRYDVVLIRIIFCQPASKRLSFSSYF